MSNKDFILEDGMWRGDFEWETTDKKRVIFKRNPNGKFIVLPHEPATDQPQKEWEIVAYNYAGNICEENGGYFWSHKIMEAFTEGQLKELNCLIHSVRRLSDGEVFTVGDRYSNNHCGIYTEHKIKDFVVSGNELQVWPEDGGYYPLFSIKKIPAKTPLFTTEDGKPVYEGDWVAVTSTSTWDVNPEVGPGELGRYREGDKGQFKYFSHEKVAREWVLMNKPCLSVNDVVDKIKRICDGTFTDDYSRWNWVLGTRNGNPENVINHFKELAKTKINP